MVDFKLAIINALQLKISYHDNVWLPFPLRSEYLLMPLKV